MSPPHPIQGIHDRWGNRVDSVEPWLVLMNRYVVSRSILEEVFEKEVLIVFHVTAPYRF